MSKEKTAIQEMIDFCTQEMRSTGSVLAQMAYRNTLAKAIELRDTVEEEQMIEAIKLGQKNVTGMDAWKKTYLRCTPKELYNEKYGSDETQL